MSGEDTTFELPSKDKDGNAVTWYTEKGSDVTTISKKDENTVTVTVKGINEQVLLTTDKSKAEGLNVHCFVLIDQQPVEVGLLTTTKTQSDTSWGTGKNYTRYYITSAQAETVYKKYGFDASQYAPNTTDAQKYNFAIGFYDSSNGDGDNPDRMWPDIAPIEADGEAMHFERKICHNDPAVQGRRKVVCQRHPSETGEYQWRQGGLYRNRQPKDHLHNESFAHADQCVCRD